LTVAANPTTGILDLGSRLVLAGISTNQDIPFLQSWDTDNLAKTLANSTFDF
jgi:hypothetical protein